MSGATTTQTVALVRGERAELGDRRQPLARGPTRSTPRTTVTRTTAPQAASSCEPFSVGLTTSVPSTTVFDAGSNAAWTGTEVTGASAYDTSTVTAVNGIEPTGTVTYSFFSNGTCASSPASTSDGDAGRRVVPNSSTKGPLAAGSYSFDATYNGDSNYSPSGPSSCEPFTRGPDDLCPHRPLSSTPASNAAWTGTEVTGASAYDTSTVAGVAGSPRPGPSPTRSSPTGTCTSSPASTSDGDPVGRDRCRSPRRRRPSAPGPTRSTPRTTVTRITAHRRRARVSPSRSPRPLRRPRPPSSTRLERGLDGLRGDGGQRLRHLGREPGLSGFTPTGTVTYSFFSNATCTSSPASTSTVTLSGGSVPKSQRRRPSAPGPTRSTPRTAVTRITPASPASTCEPFTVTKATPLDLDHCLRRRLERSVDGLRGDGGQRLRHLDGDRRQRHPAHGDRHLLVLLQCVVHEHPGDDPPDGDAVVAGQCRTRRIRAR